MLGAYLLNFILFTELEWLWLKGNLFVRLSSFVVASKYKHFFICIQTYDGMVGATSDIDTINRFDLDVLFFYLWLFSCRLSLGLAVFLEFYLLEAESFLCMFTKSEQATSLILSNGMKLELVALGVFKQAVNDVVVLSFAPGNPNPLGRKRLIFFLFLFHIFCGFLVFFLV